MSTNFATTQEPVSTDCLIGNVI